MPDDTATVSTKPFQTVSFYATGGNEINLTKAEIEERMVVETLHANGLHNSIAPAVEAANKVWNDLISYKQALTKLWALRVNQLFHDFPKMHAFRFRTFEADYRGSSYHMYPTILLKTDETFNDAPRWNEGLWTKRASYQFMSKEEIKEFEESARGQAYGATFSVLELFPTWFYVQLFGYPTMVTVTAETSVGYLYDDNRGLNEETDWHRKQYAVNDAMYQAASDETDDDDDDDDEVCDEDEDEDTEDDDPEATLDEILAKIKAATAK